MASLDTLMRELLPAGGVAIPGAREEHIELLEVATGRVWMTLEAATRQDYDELLADLDESFSPVGIGSASMDAALFKYSPGGEGEPVREKTIGGRRFINVAAPGEPTPLSGGMVEIMVHKAHVVGFVAGRTLTVLSLPEGDFVEVVGTPDNDGDIKLPEGGSLRQVVLNRPWVVPLPNPARTLWSFSPQMRSFQGPVTLPGNL